MRFTVREVANAHEFKQFYQFQNRLYRNCPTYVPSLDFDQKHTLAHSPCLDYCEQKLFLCFDAEGRIAGRCCAIINPHGEIEAQTKTNKEEILIHSCDFDSVFALREAFPISKFWRKTE